jgi:arylsulfatase A-like enzyme
MPMDRSDRRGAAEARARWTRAAVGLALLPALTAAAGCGGRAPYDGPPNVVLCVVDTLRADHTTIGGNVNDTTPNLAEWSQGGTVFERAWSSCSWTLPSVSMLMTGRARSDNGRHLPPEHTSVTERLSEVGYGTYGISSNALLLPQVGWGRGFDRYEVYEHPADGRRARGWSADQVVGRAIDMLDEHPYGQPFFLFCLLFDPHDPYTPIGGVRFESQRSMERAREFQESLRPEDAGAWNERAYAGIESRRAAYDSEVWLADHAIGTLFDYLEERGVVDDTLVVVTSDHGEGLWTRPRPVGEPNKESNFFAPLYMDHGLALHSEQVHVPLVLRGPGVPAGEVVGRDVGLLDLVPTLERLLDLDSIGPLDGVDLIEPSQSDEPRAIPGFTSRGGSVLLDGRWRLHLPSRKREELFGVGPELFDLVADPRERRPVTDAALTQDLTERFGEWFERGRVERDDHAFTEADRGLLESLGYTGGEVEQN